MNYDNWKLETPDQFEDDDDELIQCYECREEMEWNRITNLCLKCGEESA
jgi:hypothetical protein